MASTLVMFAAACSTENDNDSGGNDSSEEDSTPVAGFELSFRDLSKTIKVSGTVEPLYRMRLNSHIGGVLTTLVVEEGDTVTEGEVIAESELSELRAEKQRALAEVDAFRQRYERKKPLVKSNAVRQSDVDDLRSQIEIAERDVDLWETRISLSRIRAPRDAVVTERHVDPGGYVGVNEPIVDLADLSTLILPVRMSERDVVHLDQDDVVDVVVDAYPERGFQGRIRRIFPTADADSRRVTVEIELSGIPDGMTVRPGFLARATIDVDRRRDALAIPAESLLASQPDDSFVYVVEDQILVRRSVITGVDRRNWMEITDGLEPGEVIIGTNPTNLREGTRVHVSEWVEGP